VANIGGKHQEEEELAPAYLLLLSFQPPDKPGAHGFGRRSLIRLCWHATCRGPLTPSDAIVLGLHYHAALT